MFFLSTDYSLALLVLSRPRISLANVRLVKNYKSSNVVRGFEFQGSYYIGWLEMAKGAGNCTVITSHIHRLTMLENYLDEYDAQVQVHS